MWRLANLAAPTARRTITNALRSAHRNDLRFAATAFSSQSESILSGTSATYIDQMHQAWRRDPSSVHPSWNAYFQNLAGGAPPSQAYQPPPVLGGAVAQPGTVVPLVEDQSPLETRVSLLIRAYQVRGHENARLDPLGLQSIDRPKELDWKNYFSEAELDQTVNISNSLLSGFFSADFPPTTVRALVDRLEETYCDTIGVEYMHIMDREECNWLRSKFETPAKFTFDSEKKKHIFDRLHRADAFERFLAKKFSKGTKRFGLEGAESLIPAMKFCIDRGVEQGVSDVVIGMPHRGRLNVLANVMRKPLEVLLSQFQSQPAPTVDDDGDFSFSGDVKYHLGTSDDRVYPDGSHLHLSLLANPSHLEAVNPVVAGKARAKQYYLRDQNRKKVVPILLHGDAAFAGQGVVAETLDMAGLFDYTVGGTIHYVVNNQIGFTTNPFESRASKHSTDLAKMVGAPVLHVNGDDPEAVVYVSEVAMEWRQKFGKDVVIDMVCYRRHGHNEGDEPEYTQPAMYQTIKKHVATEKLYAQKLVADQVMTDAEVKAVQAEVLAQMEQAFVNSKTVEEKQSEWLSSKWEGFKGPDQNARIQETGYSKDALMEIGRKITDVSDHIDMHRKLKKIYAQRLDAINTGKGIDWALGEQLAFATLLQEGNHVRLSGQDVERGTFSHRHAVLHSQSHHGHNNPQGSYIPLNHVSDGQAEFVVTNSSLSEYGVLGFELGYSLENPNQLVIWEAQFGDFVNGAQIIIDQFISSGEAKWLRQSGLVMLLPHGYQGQGPEHSSARLERFLQMSDDDPDRIPDMEMQHQAQNWAIANPTTPANYYHLLRRQVHRAFRKPLIVMAPKGLLRHPLAVSSLDEFGEGSQFQRFIPETESLVAAKKVRRAIICSGQVYYDLIKHREASGVNDVAIARLEQLSPFPFDLVQEYAKKYPNAELMYAQEEPKNMGGWTYVQPRIETSDREVKGRRVSYAGRPTAASPATGFPAIHQQELDDLLHTAFA